MIGETKGKWRHTISKNGRHQISGDNGAQVASLWNCPALEEHAKLICQAKDMRELLKKIVYGRGEMWVSGLKPLHMQEDDIAEAMKILGVTGG